MWIKGGVIVKERERQAIHCGQGSSKENGNDMMKRAEETNKKQRQMIIDNERKVHEHRREMHRQGYRNYTNTEQTSRERKTYKSEIQRCARLASIHRQQLNDIRSLRSKPAQAHLQSIHTKIIIQEYDT
jgi:hypothetical protein